MQDAKIDAWVVSIYKETDGEQIFLELALKPNIAFKTEHEAVEYCNTFIKNEGHGWDIRSPFVMYDRVESEEEIAGEMYHFTNWYVITAMEFGVKHEDQTEPLKHPGVLA